MKKHVIRTVVLWIVLIAFAFGIGYLSRGNRGSVVQKESHVHEELSSPDVLYWTCSMHPQIRMSKPGKCPICGMDLIPVKPSGGQTKEDSGPRELVMSERARKLAGIRVEPVIRKAAAHEIQLFGKVVYDETRIGYITSRFPGRLDKLYVDYTGTFIKKNQPMAEIYSPELLTAQQELIHALQTVAALKNSKVEIIKRSAEATVEAARQKLRLLDLTDEQIRKLETKETFDEHITIYAPLSGVVIKKEALEGMYVDTGTTFYTVADLANVWVFLDAYESDIQWLKLNQNVTFEAEAFPGRAFHGPITFIDPVVDQKTRTIKIRIQVDNSDYSLKPDMFVRASVQTKTSRKGSEVPLIIPASAPLITGKRAVVYVQSPGKTEVYQGREVVLGPRLGDYYEVRSGLQEGENVVVEGNFKIDSAIQILAKPSMMNPEGSIVPAKDHDHHSDTNNQGSDMKEHGSDSKKHNSDTVQIK